MCGIAGAAWDSNGVPISPQSLDRMTDILQHRGPDGRGVYYQQYENGSGIALGHRRLAIIDLGGGQQPLCNEDGSVWVTFNGEIYNFRELRQDLVKRGHRFKTDSDTETIVHLYEDYGEQCLQYLRGMFAFALWDAKQQSLLLARDRLGEKPLVYHLHEGRLSFASEIKSLLQIPSIVRKVDPEALSQYLTFGYVPHPRTMFCGIQKLPPAHFAKFKRGRFTLERYWEPDWNREDKIPLPELKEKLKEELVESVRLRLRSDVPIGAFLSGGIDSTVIVGLMQEQLPHPTRTFTMGFPESGYDETPYARQAARHLGTEHCELVVDPASAGLLPTLTWHFDEPFGDSSAIPTFGLAQATRAHVKVAMTGDGGDELFAGYPRYQTVQRLDAFDRLPSLVKSLITMPVWQRLTGSDSQSAFLSRLRFRLGILGQPSDARYLNWVSRFQKSQLAHLLSENFQQHIFEQTETEIVQALQVSSRSAGIRAMQCDLQTYLPGDLLAKVDITSMAHGLECRSPFLDHHVVEQALAIPWRHHIDRSVVKPMLTRTFKDMVPKRLQTRGKQGFCVPLDAWFRGPLRAMAQDMLQTNSGLQRGYFRTDAVASLMAQHLSGKWNHGEKLWMLLCLEQWHRDFIDSGEHPSMPQAVQVPRTSALSRKHEASSHAVFS
jgi:asparagine synthase (glutamine-hydrolysing)